MANKNTHPFTPEGVLARMRDTRIDYRVTAIADVFEVTPTEMREVLEGLRAAGLVRANIEKRATRYWAPTENEIAAAIAAVVRPREFKPLRGYDKTMRDIACAAERGR